MLRRIVLFALIILSAFAPGSAAAQPRPDAEAAAAAEEAAHNRTLARLREARRLLGPAAIGTNRIGGDNAVLAVCNTSSGAMRLVHVRGGISRTRGFSVDLVTRNGVNSRYRVTSPEGWTVLAIKTNVRGNGRTVRAAIYVPYNPALHTPRMENDGREYLLSLVDRAGDRLDTRRVRSLYDTDRAVTETVPTRVLLALLIIEHIDPDDFASQGAETTTGRVYATLALNREDAYRYAGSYAGALGLAQFIRGTYRATRTRYPAAGLPADFRAGMTDHIMAVGAQYCLADWSLTRLPRPVVRRLAAHHEEDLGAYLAAAYNGGEDRAAAAYVASPEHWEEAGHGLASQTVNYVREFRAVYRLLGR